MFLFSPINFTFLAVPLPPLVKTMGLPLMTTPITGMTVPFFCLEVPRKMVSFCNRLFPSTKGTNLRLLSTEVIDLGATGEVAGLLVPTVAFVFAEAFVLADGTWLRAA